MVAAAGRNPPGCGEEPLVGRGRRGKAGDLRKLGPLVERWQGQLPALEYGGTHLQGEWAWGLWHPSVCLATVSQKLGQMSQMLDLGSVPERVTEQDWAPGKDWRGTVRAAPERPGSGSGSKLPVLA